MTRHVAGGYREPIRHMRHEVRPRLLNRIGDGVEYPVHHEKEPAENILGNPIPVKEGYAMFERHAYYAHEWMVPTWVVERIEVDAEEPAVHEYGYYVLHTAHFWSRILRADVLNQMDRYKKTEIVNELEATDSTTTQVQRDHNMIDYTGEASYYPVAPEIRKERPDEP